MALTVSPNEALKDPLDGSAIIKLTGPGSRLHKFVHVFSDIALRACPDLTKIVDVAQDHGFAVDEMDTETRKSMGMGPNSLFLCGGKGANPRSEDITSSIQVNCGSDFHFEFALEFILDPSLTPEVIQNALFSHLEIADTARSEGVALLDLHEQTYTVRTLCASCGFWESLLPASKVATRFEEPTNLHVHQLSLANLIERI